MVGICDRELRQRDDVISSAGRLQGVHRLQDHPEGPGSYLPRGRLGLLHFRGH